MRNRTDYDNTVRPHNSFTGEELDRKIKKKAAVQSVVILAVGVIIAAVLGIQTHNVKVGVAAFIAAVAFIPSCYMPVFRRYLAKKDEEYRKNH